MYSFYCIFDHLISYAYFEHKRLPPAFEDYFIESKTLNTNKYIRWFIIL